MRHVSERPSPAKRSLTGPRLVSVYVAPWQLLLAHPVGPIEFARAPTAVRTRAAHERAATLRRADVLRVMSSPQCRGRQDARPKTRGHTTRVTEKSSLAPNFLPCQRGSDRQMS